jgi:UDP-N-acetylmuramate dehydrogenase
MPIFEENIPLRRLSNYKIGGPAQFFFAPKNEKEVAWAVREARAKKLPVFVLGGATNLLIDDAGWRGLVLRPNIAAIKVSGTNVAVGAGASMADLLDIAAKNSLSGLEWAGGLPGTVGGAIRGNAGCFGGEMKDVIASVRSFDMKKMKIVERTARECKFAYRMSVFKTSAKNEIILSAKIHLQKGSKTSIRKAMNERINYRKEHHPLEHPNIGSIFKNVPLTTIHKQGSMQYKKALKDGTLIFRGSTFTVKTDPFPVISTAKLISEAGLRGVGSGGAMFSVKHPNFIVNIFAARSSDVKQLIGLAKLKVKEKFDVQLEEEVQIL